MKYETPQLTTLNPAIDAIQREGGNVITKNITNGGDGVNLPFGQAFNEHAVGYADWE